MEFGEHWIWRNGAEYYTAAGLRYLADAYDGEHDQAAAIVCRRLADEVDASNAADDGEAQEREVYRNLERRRLA